MPDAEVILELPITWLDNPVDGARHRLLYQSIWRALADLGVTVRPIPLAFFADEAPRLGDPDQLIISFHSRGPAGNVLRLKESYLPPYYTVDRMGYSGFSELALHPERFATAIAAVPADSAARFVATLKAETLAGNLSKYGQPDTYAPSLPARHVFMPLQTVEDPVARLAQMDQLDALDAVCHATAPLGWGVVAKRHPMCRSAHVARQLQSLQVRHPHLLCSDASIHQLIASAEAVIGANSGVLFEALVHGAHVISFGKSEFRSATTPIARPADVAGAILGRGCIDRGAQCRFLTWYLQSYCLRADDVAGWRGRIAEALLRLDIRPGAAAAARHADQMARFRDYAATEAARRRDVLRGEVAAD